jgi:hypothetical protein
MEASTGRLEKLRSPSGGMIGLLPSCHVIDWFKIASYAGHLL